MTTDPPCARCGHPAVAHETNYVERGPCWKCHTCAGYVLKLGLAIAHQPLNLAGARFAVGALLLSALPGHIHREIETWTDACGCTWANTSTRTTTCAGHAKP